MIIIQKATFSKNLFYFELVGVELTLTPTELQTAESLDLTSQEEKPNALRRLNKRLIFDFHHLFNKTQIHTFVMRAITWSFPLVCAIRNIKKRGLSLLFTSDLRARDRCVDLDVKLDPDSTVTRGFLSPPPPYFSALNFLLFFPADTNTSARWYNWLRRQPTDVRSFQLLE